MTGPQASLLPDGRRLHLHHGPIDLIIEVWGPHRDAAYKRAVTRFDGLLDALVVDLPDLRRPERTSFQDPVARRMSCAVQKLRRASSPEPFITPMAAVAGAVADEVLTSMRLGSDVPKAYVNNGGDIAVHLAPGHAMTLASPAGRITLDSKGLARGVATSGWGGRSQSLGIADAVTVAAKDAATADAAATLIANAVNLPDHPAIERTPACALSPDSDLGQRLVTMDVGPLPQADIAFALGQGLALAQSYRRAGLICDAALCLQGQSCHLSPTTEGTLAHA